MRDRLRTLLLTATLAAASGPAAGVSIEWVAVGDPGNAPDAPLTNCFSAGCGSVAYPYRISRYEVTNSQYAELLNAKAASDPLGLYHASMASDAAAGGITRSGSPDSYAYAAKPGFEARPVTYVSFWDAVRFANWLHNGQGAGDTETGAYTLTADGITFNTVTRNAGALVFLPGENEWYKAAYYDAGTTSYFDYPAGSDGQIDCVVPAGDAGNAANCQGWVGAPTPVGAYAFSASPYGSFDQGGNVGEWNEDIYEGSFRGMRGGGWKVDGAIMLAAWNRSAGPPTDEADILGFRVASPAPEPALPLLALTGSLTLPAARRRRAGRSEHGDRAGRRSGDGLA